MPTMTPTQRWAIRSTRASRLAALPDSSRRLNFQPCARTQWWGLAVHAGVGRLRPTATANMNRGIDELQADAGHGGEHGQRQAAFCWSGPFDDLARHSRGGASR